MLCYICEEEAERKCQSCRKPVCAEHLEEAVFCEDCYYEDEENEEYYR